MTINLFSERTTQQINVSFESQNCFDCGLMTVWPWLSFKKHLISLSMTYIYGNWVLLDFMMIPLHSFNLIYQVEKFPINLKRSFSEISSISCVSPQWSINASLLFLIYFIGILVEVNRNLFLLADDICLAFQSINVKDAEKQLNQDFPKPHQ